jgi:hypothetical protein
VASRERAVEATIRARDRSSEAIQRLERAGASEGVRAAVRDAHAELEALVTELVRERHAA